MLNLLTLEPGESLYVAPGELHAYLKGEALELMANSDNVIRGGLTSKHVDLPELISVLSFDSERPKPFKAEGLSSEEELFPLLAPDFRLSRIRTGDDRLRRRPRGPEIILCAEGRAVLEDAEGSFVLARGEAAFVRADASEYSISGEALLYLSFVPPPEIRD
jgi:mannose-6-phosphate isomerase